MTELTEQEKQETELKEAIEKCNEAILKYNVDKNTYNRALNQLYGDWK